MNYDKERLGIILKEVGYQNNRTESKQIVPFVYRKEYQFVNQFRQGFGMSIVFDLRPNNHVRLWLFDHQKMEYIKDFPHIKFIKEMQYISETISKENIMVVNGIDE